MKKQVSIVLGVIVGLVILGFIVKGFYDSNRHLGHNNANQQTGKDMPTPNDAHNMMSGMSNSGAMDNMHMDMTISSEEQFIRNMIPHHIEAIETSKQIVARSTDDKLKKLAQEIIDGQTKEVVMMQGRLQSRYPNSTMTAHYINMMPNLTQLTGKKLDQEYIEGMIMHHKGAIEMAQRVLIVNPAPRMEVGNFAHHIIDLQTLEVGQLKSLWGDDRKDRTDKDWNDAFSKKRPVSLR